MADVYRIQKTTLDAIGNSIRAKTGKSALIPPDDMPEEIESIETGGDGEEVLELHTITGIVLASSTSPYTLLNAYISKCVQWCYFPTSESPSISSVARGFNFSGNSGTVWPINLLGDTGSNSENTALTNSVPLPVQYQVNDQSVSSTRMRGNINNIPAGIYTLKFYGVAK